MIFMFFLNAILSFFQVILSVIPDFPDTPQQVIDGGGVLISFIAKTASVGAFMYGTPLFLLFVTLIIFMFQFDNAYSMAKFIVKKIPFINVRL